MNAAPSGIRRRHIAATLLIIVSVVAYLVLGESCRQRAPLAVKKATVALQRGAAETARSELAWLLWFEPTHPEALHVTGLSLMNEGRFGEASDVLNRVSAESRIHRQSHMSMAAAYAADHAWQRAEEVLLEHLKLYPEAWDARRQLSGLLLTQLRQRDAVALLKAALSPDFQSTFNPDVQLDLLLDLLVAEFSPPLPQECLQRLEAVQIAQPGQPAILRALGECYWKTDKTADAWSYLTDSLTLAPTVSGTRILCAAYLLDQKQETAAAALLQAEDLAVDAAIACVAQLTQDDRYWELRCRIAEHQSQFLEALSHISKALDIQPTASPYISRKARLLQRLGRTGEAQQAYIDSHKMSAAELRLWKLSRSLGDEVPSETDCQEVESLYQLLGKAAQAAAWRDMASELAKQSIPEQRQFDPVQQ